MDIKIVTRTKVFSWMGKYEDLEKGSHDMEERINAFLAKGEDCHPDASIHNVKWFYTGYNEVNSHPSCICVIIYHIPKHKLGEEQ